MSRSRRSVPLLRLAAAVAATAVTTLAAAPALAAPAAPGPAPSSSAAASPAPTASAAPAAAEKAAGKPAASPAPHQAAKVTVEFPWRTLNLPTGGQPKVITPRVFNDSDVPATNVLLNMDLAGSGDHVDVKIPSTCDYVGIVIECALGTVPAHTEAEVPRLTAVARYDAKPGDTATLPAAVQGGLDDRWPGRIAELPMTITDPDTDISVAAHDLTIKPGGTAPVQWAISNDGTQAVDAVSMRFSAGKYAGFAGRYPGCAYDAASRTLDCVFEGFSLKPGDVLLPSATAPVAIRLSRLAPGPQLIGADVTAGLLSPSAAAKAGLRRGAAHGPAPVRTVSRREAGTWVPDLNDRDNTASYSIKVTKNPADLAAIGTDVHGSRGATVPMPVGLTDNGPADGPARIGTWAPTVRVTAPSGTRVTRAPDTCQPITAGRVYRCFPLHAVALHERITFDLRLRIEADGQHPGGSVTVDGGVFDQTTANNTAPITVNADAGGIGGGSLPVTGARTGPVLAGGAALLLVGGALVVLARRRTTRRAAR